MEIMGRAQSKFTPNFSFYLLGPLPLALVPVMFSGLREVDGAEFCRAQQVTAGSMSGVQEQVALSEGPQQQTVGREGPEFMGSLMW